MTEQEKRIEEMAKQGLKKTQIFEEMCKIAYPIYSPNDIEYYALMKLVDAGYRKADEVLSCLYKKVDKLLFENSKTTRDKVLAGKCKAYAEIKELILETAKACGVEVEE